VRTGYQQADIFTKPLTKVVCQTLCKGLGLANLHFSESKDKTHVVTAKTMTTGGVATELAQAVAKALVNAGLDALRQQSDPTTTASRMATVTDSTCPTTTSSLDTATQPCSTFATQGLVAGAAVVGLQALLALAYCKLRGRRRRTWNEENGQQGVEVCDMGSMSQCACDCLQAQTDSGRFRFLGRVQVDRLQETGRTFPVDRNR
jgi:hypothetical protein